VRPSTSIELPAGADIRNLIGLSGQVCAPAPGATSSVSAMQAIAVIRFIIVSPMPMDVIVEKAS
jgi:hypothetical protein